MLTSAGATVIGGVVMMAVGFLAGKAGGAIARRREEKELLGKLGEIIKVVNALKKGMKAELRESLIDAHKKYVIDGETLTVERFHELNEIYEAYKDLEGNGTGDKVFDDIRRKGPTIIN